MPQICPTVTDWITASAAVIAVAVYIQQALIARHAAAAAGIVSVVNLLNSPEAETARGIVRGGRLRHPIGEWKAEDRAAAVLVCNNYDLAAILIKRRVVPPDLVVENWGKSIVDCFEKTRPLREEARAGTSGADHWKNFEWLYMLSVKHWSAREARAD